MNTQNAKKLQIPYGFVTDKVFVVYFRIFFSNMDEDTQKPLHVTAGRRVQNWICKLHFLLNGQIKTCT